MIYSYRSIPYSREKEGITVTCINKGMSPEQTLKPVVTEYTEWTVYRKLKELQN